MIVTGILYLVFYFLSALISPLRLLPNASLPTNFTDALITAGGGLSAISMVLPIPTLLAILGLIVGIDVGIMTYKILIRVYRFLRGG